MKRAIILGSAGQDGTYLRAHLEGMGYRVLGVASGSPVDITRPEDAASLVSGFQPDEIYHLAALHRSSETGEEVSSSTFERMYKVNFFSLLHFLDAMVRSAPSARLFYAASSHIFDGTVPAPQDEHTPMDPRSIYAMTKADGRRACGMYRERFGLHASAGILYGHESSLRPPGFLSRKVVEGALDIAEGKMDLLHVGDLSAQVDWGWAPDYVEAMHAILQLESGGDYIISSGRARPVEGFVAAVFQRLGMDWRERVRENPGVLLRRGPVRVGNPVRLKSATGWEARMDLETIADRLLEAAMEARLRHEP